MLAFIRPQTSKRFHLRKALPEKVGALTIPGKKNVLADQGEFQLPVLFKDESPYAEDAFLQEAPEELSSPEPQTPSSSGSEQQLHSPVLDNQGPSPTRLAARLAQHRIYSQGPAKLGIDKVTFTETQAQPQIIRKEILDEIISMDASLLEPVRKQRDPMAPPPALEPRGPTNKQKEAIKSQLTVQQGEQTIRAVAVDVDIVLERRRWVWRKVAQANGQPLSAMDPNEQGDPWQIELRTQAHDQLVDEARNSADRRSKMEFEYPNIHAITGCKVCKARGATTCKQCDGIEADQCFWCEGSGKQTYNGKSSSKCKRCDGTGTYVCGSCHNLPMIRCEPCHGEGVVVSQLFCAFDIKVVKLPPVFMELYRNNDERTTLLENVCANINSVYHGDYKASQRSSPSHSRSGSSHGAPSSSASSQKSIADHRHGPVSSSWFPVAAHCVLDSYEATSVMVDKPMPSCKKNRLRLRSQSDLHARHSQPVFLRNHYIVSSSNLVPIRKVGDGTLSMPSTPFANSTVSLA